MDTIIQNIVDIMNHYDIADDNENRDKAQQGSIVILNISKIDNSWKKSRLYISPVFSEIEQKDKYNNSKNDLLNMNVEKPPSIFINDMNRKNKYIEFIDGRNRFSNLREMNCLYMPFIVYNVEKKKLIKLFP